MDGATSGTTAGKLVSSAWSVILPSLVCESMSGCWHLSFMECLEEAKWGNSFRHESFILLKAAKAQKNLEYSLAGILTKLRTQRV
jgi:hypothetical protein